MVRQLAVRVCARLGLGEAEQALVDVAARVRDVGLIALPDSVVLATDRLSAREWELMMSHPALGADLLETAEGLEPVADVVRCHHERWDGEGYPAGRAGEDIPLLARVIATCDAFVAMAHDRPHRSGVGVEAAIDHLEREGGQQLDRRTVDALVAVLRNRDRGPRDGPVSRDGAGEGEGKPAAKAGGRAGQRAQAPQGGGLSRAIDAVEELPAFGPAVERLIAVAQEGGGTPGDVVSAVESDTGLTVAVLRAAQSSPRSRKPVASVSDAVSVLAPGEIQRIATTLPRAAFPWQTASEALMHHLRVHGQAVARAAERVARELALRNGDDLLAAALLHDVGKLVLARTAPEIAGALAESTPEARVARERQATGVDHASLGGLLLTRWGLPDGLAQAVAAHHRCEEEGELATLVRLADMIAHHAHGDAVDRRLMLRLAAICGLPVKALRDAMFDLPHSGGSRRRRAEPSPLSDRETEVLRRLAEGLVYREIGEHLGLSTSTVRTHLHNAYTKMDVADRAQAVLKATEMAWI